MSRKHKQRRQTLQPKTCLFCGSAGPLTDEHIYGRWLRKLGYTGNGVREITPRHGGQPIIQRGGPFSKTLKIVCRVCNGDWMGTSMEQPAESLLTAMFNNPAGGKVRLDADAQLLLARWAFKTAAVLARVDWGESIPEEHRREFHRTDRPPQQVEIRIGAGSITTSPKGTQLAAAAYDPRSITMTRSGQTLTFPCYRTTFRLLTVVFDVFGYLADNVTLDIDPLNELNRILLPIWPAQHPSIWWPPVSSLDTVGGVSDRPLDHVQGIPSFVPSRP